MLKKGLVLMLALFAMTALFAGCSDDDSSDSSFVGKWQITDPASGKREQDVVFNSNGTLWLYEPGNPSVKGTGTYSVSGKTATGTWQAGDFNGAIKATLTDATHMDYDFGENKYVPMKHFYWKGVKIS